MGARFSGFGLWLLTAGFFIYSWMVGEGYFPAVFGGYINEISILLIFGFVLLYIADVDRRKTFSTYDFKLALWFVMCAGIFFVNYIRGVSIQVSYSHAAYLLQAIALFLCARNSRLGDAWLVRLFVLSLILMSVLVLFRVFDGTLIELVRREDDLQRATYQDFARSYLFVVFFVMAWIKRQGYRVGVFLLAFPVLLFLGSRSELIGLIVSWVVIEFFLSGRKVYFLAAGLIMTLLILGLLPLLKVLMPDSRVLLLLEYGSDDSVSERAEQIIFSLKTIANNPIFGDYGSYSRIGGSGAYAHNVLSAWVDLGFLGFVYYIFLIILSFYVALNFRSSIKGEEVTSSDMLSLRAQCLSVWLVVLIFAIFAKSYTDMNFILMVAIVAQYRLRMLQEYC